MPYSEFEGKTERDLTLTKLQGITLPTAIFNKTINQPGGMFIPVSQHIIQIQHLFPRHKQIMNCPLKQEEDEAHLVTTSIKTESTKSEI